MAELRCRGGRSVMMFTGVRGPRVNRGRRGAQLHFDEVNSQVLGRVRAAERGHHRRPASGWGRSNQGGSQRFLSRRLSGVARGHPGSPLAYCVSCAIDVLTYTAINSLRGWIEPPGKGRGTRRGIKNPGRSKVFQSVSHCDTPSSRSWRRHLSALPLPGASMASATYDS
jgi:hypothetical protein